MNTRALERFAVAALAAAIILIVADRIAHPRGFLFLPLRYRPPHPWRGFEALVRLRPALAAGVALLVSGLLTALVTGCAELVRLIGNHRS